jgi:hypothetical protein
MAERSDFQVRLFGLEELQRLEASLDGRRRRLAQGIAEGIAGELADASPKGQTGALAASWKGRAIADGLAVVESNHPAAKARDRGAYIEPHQGDVVRFTNSFGDLVFARFVRQQGTHYVRRGLAKRRVIAEAVFEREYSNLKGAAE